MSLVADPKGAIDHEPGGLGRSLAGRPVTSMVCRHSFDLPKIAVEVTEHRLVERECVRGARVPGQAPTGVDAPVRHKGRRLRRS